MYVCLCNSVTDHDIRSAITEGCRSVPALCARLGVATRCGQCRTHTQELLRETLPHAAMSPVHTTAMHRHAPGAI